MSKIKNTLYSITAFCFLLSVSSHGQSISRKVVSPAGGTLTGGGNMLTFTIGETVIPTLTAGGSMITQGFEQPGEQVRTGTVAASVCAGSTFSLPYTAIDIGGGNTFTAQLSDATGSFASPVSIGTLAGNASTGTINVTIPSNTTAGTAYRIRVVSSSPGKIGADNGVDITVATPSVAATAASCTAPFNEICLGNNTTLSFTDGSLGSGATWNWYSGSCGGALAGTGTAISVSPTVTTTYFVRAEGICNTTPCQSVTIAVSAAPDSANVILPFTGMPANICSGTTATLNIAPVAGATQYTWDVPTGGYFNGNPLNVSPFITSVPTVQVTYGAPVASLYSTGVQAGNACGNSIRKTQKNRGTTSVPTAVTGPLTACANSSISYSTSAVSGAVSYLWTITGNATVSGTGATAIISFGPSWNGGTLCVAAQTTCYTSPSKCITISKSAATLNAISGSFTACPNSVLSYSVPVSAGASSYNWTVPAGATVTNGQGTRTIDVTFSAGYSAVGNICVNVTSICGVTSVNKCKSIAPGLPAQPASIAGSTNGLCGQSVVNTCPSQGAGITYTWTAPPGASIVSGQGGTSVNVSYGNFSTGSLCVKASNTCGSSTARCITVKGSPATPGSIIATPASWCSNTNGIEFNANVANLTGSYTLSWTFPPANVATYVLGGGNASFLILDWLTGTGGINLTAYNNCGSGTKTSTWSSTCREADNSDANTLTVWPNPATGWINISCPANTGITGITVIDLAGRVVVSKTVNSTHSVNTTQFDMTKLAKGSYLLTVHTTAGSKPVKIALE